MRLLLRRTYNHAAPSGLRDRKAPKDGQQPCFTPKGRSHLSQSLIAVTVRLARSWEDVYRHRPLFTLFYRRHPHQKIETAPPGVVLLSWGTSLSCGCSPAPSAPPKELPRAVGWFGWFGSRVRGRVRGGAGLLRPSARGMPPVAGLWARTSALALATRGVSEPGKP
jgi:hypothetical protein